VWQEGAKPRPASDLLSFTGSRGEAGKLAPRWLPQG
jgi:hypothetical protein